MPRFGARAFIGSRHSLTCTNLSPIFFSNWMLQAHKHKTNTLGYAVNSINSNDKDIIVNPTFLPTSNQFQTCEWRNESDGKIFQGRTSDNAANGNNCLLYLQQTMGNAIPDPVRYDYSGNLIDDQKSGTLLISKKLFWDEWLLRELQELNYVTLLVAKRAHCSNNEISPDWEYDWKSGKGAADDAGRKDAFDPFYAWKPKPDDPHTFTFSDSSRCEDSGGIWGSKLNCYIECHTTNEITFNPGQLPPIISIKGTTGAVVERDTDAAGTAHAWMDLNWNCEIEMSSVSKTTGTQSSNIPGGLLTRITSSNFPPVDAHTDEPKFAAQTAPDGVKNDIANLLTSLGLEAITKKIETGLEGAHKFILPGSGTFAMSNPVFNNNSDFLVDIQYEPSQTKPV